MTFGLCSHKVVINMTKSTILVKLRIYHHLRYQFPLINLRSIQLIHAKETISMFERIIDMVTIIFSIITIISYML